MYHYLARPPAGRNIARPSALIFMSAINSNDTLPVPKFIGKIIDLFKAIPLPIALALIVLAALLPVLNNGFVNYDDPQYVLSNPALRGSWSDALAFSPGYYHPLVTLTYKAEYSFFGLAPRPYHITNLELHLANCLSVFYLFVLLGWRRGAAFLGALLFGVHPVHVEPVAWISGRKELLWGLFSFWTLNCYLKYIDTGKTRFFIVSLVCFILSVLSKPFALILVLALPLADLYRERRFGIIQLAEKVPYLLAAFSLFLLSWVPSGFLLSSDAPALTPLNFAALITENLLFYAKKLILPVKLSALYPPPDFPVSPAIWFVLLFAAASGLYGIRRYWRASAKSAAARTAVFCLSFFVISVFPALLVFPPADRYGYVSGAGLCFLYSFWVWRLYELLEQSSYSARLSAIGTGSLKRFFSPGRVLAALVTAHCCVFAAASFERAAVWRNSFTLAEDILEKNPVEPLAYCLRAGAQREAQRYPDALKDYDRCLELKPDDPAMLISRIRTLLDMKEFDRVIADSGAAIAKYPGAPQLFLYRGLAHFFKGDYAAALKDYDHTLVIAPDFTAAIENKRVVLEKLKSPRRN